MLDFCVLLFLCVKTGKKFQSACVVFCMNNMLLLPFNNVPSHFTIRSPIMTDAVWCTPTRGITYSVSHHVGCRLVHPNTWYQLFGLPSCWMPFGAPQHVVSIIRSPIMLDAVWCTPTRGINYSVSHHVGCRLVHPNTWYQLFGLPSCWMPFGAPQHVVSIIRSPIMLDAVWCTPTRGINYSVSHHVGCRLVYPNTWYQLFGLPSCWMTFGAPQHVVSIKCHTPSRRMPIGASRQVGHFFNAIRHHDGC